MNSPSTMTIWSGLPLKPVFSSDNSPAVASSSEYAMSVFSSIPALILATSSALSASNALWSCQDASNVQIIATVTKMKPACSLSSAPYRPIACNPKMVAPISRPASTLPPWRHPPMKPWGSNVRGIADSSRFFSSSNSSDFSIGRSIHFLHGR